ncbi:MAG: glycoside hydrolase family 108 protein [Anaeroplasmataceae bacterium]
MRKNDNILIGLCIATTFLLGISASEIFNRRTRTTKEIIREIEIVKEIKVDVIKEIEVVKEIEIPCLHIDNNDISFDKATSINYANFDISIDKVSKWEGDKYIETKFGEKSKYGVTKETVALYNKLYKKNLNVKYLSKNEAKAIYKKMWWDNLKLNLLTSQELANAILDFAVNSGHKRAIIELQKSLNEELHILGEPTLTVDGVIGTETITVINKFATDNTVNHYNRHRLSFMKSLGDKWDSFGKGWTRRVNDFMIDVK